MRKDPPTSVQTVRIEELEPDPNNVNIGTRRGGKLLAESIGANGISKAPVVDRNLKTIAGNKTIAAARRAGYRTAIVVDADKDTLVVVRRTDLDMERDDEAEDLAIADNLIASVNLRVDTARLEAFKASGRALPILESPEARNLLEQARRQHFADTREDLSRVHMARLHMCPNCRYEFED